MYMYLVSELCINEVFCKPICKYSQTCLEHKEGQNAWLRHMLALGRSLPNTGQFIVGI